MDAYMDARTDDRKTMPNRGGGIKTYTNTTLFSVYLTGAQSMLNAG